MSSLSKRDASRDIFFTGVIAQAGEKDVYIVSADLAGRPFDKLRSEMPARYISTGIAEQNMVAVACGLALANKCAIAYTQGPFIDTRAFDQIRNGVCLMGLPVVVAGLSFGLGIAEYGMTHIVTEDYSVLSTCPNLQLITIADDRVAQAAVSYALETQRPLYLRFERDGYCLPDAIPVNFDKGFRMVRKGEETVVVSNGYLLGKAYSANYVTNPSVIDVFKYPFDKEALLYELAEYQKVVVYDEQQKRGGLCGDILTLLMEGGCADKKIVCMGIDYQGDFLHTYGSREYWLEHFGLAEKDLMREVDIGGK